MPRECSRCQASTASGGQCKNSTCERFPYCWVHLKQIDGLAVKPSTIAGAGKGLFAEKRFRPGETVTRYSARRVSATSSGGAADAAPPPLVLFFPEEPLPSTTERLPLAAMSDISRIFGAEAILTQAQQETRRQEQK